MLAWPSFLSHCWAKTLVNFEHFYYFISFSKQRWRASRQYKFYSLFVYFFCNFWANSRNSPRHHYTTQDWLLVENYKNATAVYSRSSFVLSASFKPAGAACVETSDWNSRIRWIRRVNTSAGRVCWSTCNSCVGWPHTMTALARCSTPFSMSPWEIKASPIWISWRKYLCTASWSVN